MNSGCICCSLVGDFGRALHQVMEQFHPDRILIEPSGVGKLSDVLKAVADAAAKEPEMVLGSAITVADGTKCRVYMKNFGEFYNNQVENAGTIVLSRTQKMDGEKLEAAVAMLWEKNPKAPIITTPWDQLSGEQILSAMDRKGELEEELLEEARRHAHACSPAGGRRPPRPSPRRRSGRSSRRWTPGSTGRCCGPRASWPAATAPGSTSTTCRRSRRSAGGLRTTPAASALSALSWMKWG